MTHISQTHTKSNEQSTPKELKNALLQGELAKEELGQMLIPQLKSIAQQRADAGEHHLAGWKRWKSRDRLIRELAKSECKSTHTPAGSPLFLEKPRQFLDDPIDVLIQLCCGKLDDWLFSNRIAISTSGRIDFRAIAIEIERRLKLLGLEHKGLEPFIAESSRSIVGATIKTKLHHQLTIPTLNLDTSYPQSREIFKREAIILFDQITRETSPPHSQCTIESNEYLKPAGIRKKLKLDKGQLHRSTLKRYRDEKKIRYRTVREGTCNRFLYHLGDVQAVF